MERLTITEALADIKTLGKRIEKKREFITPILYRQDKYKDPLEKEGGSKKAIQEAQQSVDDMLQRIADIRLAIQGANINHDITVEGKTKPIAEWIVWRREIAPIQKSILQNHSEAINGCRNQARQKGLQVYGETEQESVLDIHVNIDEKRLAEDIDQMEKILGTLDGQLSLQNAKIIIEF